MVGKLNIGLTELKIALDKAAIEQFWNRFWEITFIDVKQTFPHLKVYINVNNRITDEEYDFVEFVMAGRYTSAKDILGGAMVFKTNINGEPTRLSVLRVGQMLDKGETEFNVLDDYPYLTPDCLRFARWYKKVVYWMAGA